MLKCLAKMICDTIPSPGGFWWAYPPNKAPSPPKLKYETNEWNFCQIWMSSPSCTNVKPLAQT